MITQLFALNYPEQARSQTEQNFAGLADSEQLRIVRGDAGNPAYTGPVSLTKDRYCR